MTHRELRKKQRLYNLYISILGLAVFLGLFLISLIVANWPAVKNELAFAFKQPEPTILTTPSPSPTPQAVVEPPHVVIEKIGVDAPLQWDVPVNDTIAALDYGVAHMLGTARLGEVGNLFITGHSSDYVWKNNPYAAVFSLLPKLERGDTIKIKENGKEYVYKVIQTKIVNPDQVDVVNATNTPIVTLMTCYPIGTTRQRYIVHANLISSPEKFTQVNSLGNQTLPEIKFR